MDAFTKISGLLHALLPGFQDALDKILLTKSHDYWNAYVLKNLPPQDQRYWKQNGICSVDDVDLQGVFKILLSNYELFRDVCGEDFSARELREMRKIRNRYAHDCGAVSQKTALEQLPIIRSFAKWMKLPLCRLQLVDKVKMELETSAAPRPVKIAVGKASLTSSAIPVTEYAMTQKAADNILTIERNQGKEIGKIIAKSIKGEDGLVLTKHQKSLYSLDLGGCYVGVLFNTPNDDYIVVDVIDAAAARKWFDDYSVNYDSETGHLLISRICTTNGTCESVTEWSNDVPSDKSADGEVDLPDHGGGAVDYEPNSVKAIPLSEALKKNPSRKASMCLLDEESLRKMYDGTLENWQVYLHQDQLRAVTMNSDGPMMVKGPAGTGKTVVLVHRAKWLLENVFTANERILITTFNKSLEYAIDQMLDSICTPQQKSRMDIVYFDQWLQKAWKQIGGERILYNDEDISDVSKNLFRLKLSIARQDGSVDVDRTDEFIEREYDSIVQEYKLRDEASYLAAVRPKKFGVLRQDERRKLWQIFQIVNGDPFDPDVSPVGSSTRMRVINHVTKAIEARKFGIAGKYAAVLVDESQDMGAAEYRLLGALTGNVVGHENPNSLLFAGDGHQRIYGRMGSLMSCGINVRGGRTVQLRKCYRSSKALKRYAENLLDGYMIKDMDDVKETLDGSEAIDDGVEPIECFVRSGDYDALYDVAAKKISEWMSLGSKRLSDYAILLREGNYLKSKTWKLKKAAEAMSKRGLKAVVISKDKYDDSDSIKVMTMHRAKGMQFYGVVLNLDGWPHKPDKDADEDARKENEEDERKLLYMAIMRAVRFVLLTGTRDKSQQLARKPTLSVKKQQIFDFGADKKDTVVIKPQKRPAPKQGELPLPVVHAETNRDRNLKTVESNVYDRFIDYLKTIRQHYDDALKYRRDIKELSSDDKTKATMASFFAKQHSAALAEAWDNFVKSNDVTVSLEEAARKSISEYDLSTSSPR